MSGVHLTPELFQALERDVHAREQLASLLLSHLLSLCPRCKEIFEEVNEELTLTGAGLALYGDFEEGGAEEEEAEAVCALEAALDQASATLDTLLGLPPGRRLETVQGEPERYRGPELAYLLLEASKERLPGQPVEAQELARLASVVLQHQPDVEGTPQLYALALAHQGNARRAQGDLHGADELFTEARYFLRTEGGGPPLLIAEIDSFEGSLRRAERKLDEALELLSSAAMTYRMAEAAPDTVGVLLNRGTVHRETGDLTQAIDVTRQALELAEKIESPRLLLYARNNLAWLHQEAGDYQEAQRIVEESRPLYQRFPDPLTQLRLLWLEAAIARGLGDVETAEQTYRAVREGFLRRDLAYDAALVSLDLASLHLEQGRTGEVKALAREMLPVFRSREIHREATAALLLFVDAARAEQLTATFLQELTRYLKAARHNRELVFQPAA